MRISIVTALKDGFADFALTIPSILGQDASNFEWIIVDDGSERAVSEVFPDLMADPRVRILRNDPGLGQTKSLNRGIREAKSDWIIRMDGDDLARPDRLSLTLTAFEHHGSHVIFSDYDVIDESGRNWASVRLRKPVGPAFFKYLFEKNNPICHPTVSFRKTRSDGTTRLFREDLVNAQDYALWKEIYNEEGAASFKHIGEPLIQYRIARNSLSGARAPEQTEELKAIRQNKSLSKVARTTQALDDRQKRAMQAYRILYYRFVGWATPASIPEELALLAHVGSLPAIWPKAAYYFFARPLRKFLLRHSFEGIYE